MKKPLFLFPIILLLLAGAATTLNAQTNLTVDEDSHTINYTDGSYQDYLIPTTVTYSTLKFTLNGGDGGKRLYSPYCNAKGGQGATAVAYFTIGCGTNDLLPGSTIRFVIGESGGSDSGGGVTGGAGGGGTAILYKKVGTTDWVLLGVAGGGGGAFLNGLCDDSDGRGGSSTTDGSDGKGSNKGYGGSGGYGGGDGIGGIFDSYSGGGGGWLSDGGNGCDTNDDGIYDAGGGKAGGTTGGDGGRELCYTGGERGGHGFGGGGCGFGCGGGGGGYSGGGGGGYQGGGGGGGSYVTSMATSSTITGGGTTSSPANGYAYYEFQNNTGSEIRPDLVVTCLPSVTVDIEDCPSGVYEASAEDYVSSVTGGCGDYLYSSYEYTCSDAGSTITGTPVFVYDQTGQLGYCTTTVYVKAFPVAQCKNISVNLNSSGSVTVNSSQLNNGSYDPDGGTTSFIFFTFVGDGLTNTYTCNSIGQNTATMVVLDDEGDYDFCTATITVNDNTGPALTCKNATVNLNSSGSATITTSTVYNTGSDNCGTVNLQSVSPSSFSCSNIGSNTVTLTANDGHSNTSTCTATVTVADNTAPSVTCKSASVSLNSSGSASITTSSVYNTGSDNCGTVNQVSVSPSTFSCSNIGSNIVTLTVNDGHSNTATCTATVTVSDNTAPSVACKSASVSLNSSGSASITTSSVYNTGSDNCGTVNQVSVSPSTFSCSNLGANVVTLTVNDGHSNTATCTASVTVSDNTGPTVTCKNATVNLTGAGTASITTASVYNSGSDNCGTVNQVSVSPNSFTCSNLGSNIVTLTVNDGHSNTSTCTATVTITDANSLCNSAPTAVCQNVTVNAGSNCTASVSAAQVDNGSSDPENGPLTFSLSPAGPFSFGTTTVVLSVTDDAAHTSTCSATVTVNDNTAPTVTCNNTNVILNAAGAASITTATVFASGSDNCGTVNQVSVSPASFNCSNLGANIVTLTVNDGHGNTATCSATVTVSDTTAPTIICPANQTLAADENCSHELGDWLGASTYSDNCSDLHSGFIVQVGAINEVITENNSPYTVTILAFDASLNNSSCSFSVSLVDVSPPDITCQSVTLPLDENGNATVTTGSVFLSGSDNCGNVNLESVAPALFTCSNLGDNVVTLTANDGNGNTATCAATVTVVDNTAPTITCPTDKTVSADASCSGVVGDRRGAVSVSDNCTASSLIEVTQDPVTNSVLSGDGDFSVVTMTATDQHGNSAQCSFTVTLQDMTAPTIVCPANQTISADAGCSGEIGSWTLTSKSDNCSAVDNISETQSPAGTTVLTGHNSFSTVTLTATDEHGNSAQCSFTVTLKDVTPPTIVCPADQTVAADENCSHELGGWGDYVTLSDNCSPGYWEQVEAVNILLSGHNDSHAVTFNGYDAAGNQASCSFTVTLKDVTPPVVNCQSLTVPLGGGGFTSVSTGDIFLSGSDNCGMVNPESVSPDFFTCDNVGDNVVTLTASDGNGNTATCSATVTVIDNAGPALQCQNITVPLDGSGNATIAPEDVYLSGQDNCVTINLVSVSPDNFSCSNIGSNSVTLVASDSHGNTGDCEATVTIVDNSAPTIICPADKTVSADANCSGMVDDRRSAVSVSDNCTLTTLIDISQDPDITTMLNGDGDSRIVTMTATDSYGNSAQCSFTVTLVDDTAPTIVCPANQTVAADENCSGEVGAWDPVSVSDNCSGQISVTQSPASNTVITGRNNSTILTLTATDGHSNSAQCTFRVTLKDVTPPTIICPPDQTVAADENCSHEVGGWGDATTITDNCSDANSGFWIQLGAINQVITGHNSSLPVTIVAYDQDLNHASCTFTVTVVDVTPPAITCQSITVPLGGGGFTSIAPGDVFQSGSDNCGAVNLESVTPEFFNCDNLGDNVVTLTADDGNGNTSTCSATVTVIDNTGPAIECQSITTSLDATGNATISPADVYLFGQDNCGAVNLQSVSPAAFNCSNLGSNIVTLTVNDGHSNTASCTATVTVTDVTPPSVSCQNTTVNLDASGSGSITTGNVFLSGSDNCGVVNQQSVSPATFSCSNLGANIVTLTVNDGHGNTATCTSTVTVVDNTAPSVICKSANVSLNDLGQGSITTGSVFQSGSDNCGVVNQQSVSPASFTCSNLGTNIVTLTVNDGHGNTATCTATVTVSDLVPPTVMCKNATVNLDGNGTGSISTGNVFQSGSDNCGVVNQVSVSPNSFTCSNLGSNVVTLTVNDGHGNTSTCNATVTVADVTPPTVVCKNAQVNLNSAGSGSITTGSVFLSGADNCGVVNQVSVLPNSFNCGNLGANIVTLTVNDSHGNTATCSATVTVVDLIAPTMVCQNVTLSLDASGMATLTTGQVNNGSTDNCGIVSLSLTKTNFTCADVGATTVQLGGVDASGNKATCSAVITVQDLIKPVARCKNLNATLGSNGTYAVSTSAIDNGSSDNCSFSLSVLPASLSCNNIGINTVTLIATDASGNTGACTATVSLRDASGPVALCKNPTIYLNSNGQATLSVNDVNNGSYDNCGIQSMSLNFTEFNCSDISGTRSVTLTARDNSGNSATCTATVTVKDNTAPTAVCQNTTVHLNAYGYATVYGATLAANSFDNCSVWSYSPSAKVYTAANLGVNNLAITVKDWSGNAAVCVSQVTVLSYSSTMSASGTVDDPGTTPEETQESEFRAEEPEKGDVSLRVFPNPSSGRFSLEFELPAVQDYTVRIFDLSGRLVFDYTNEGEAGKNSFLLDLDAMQAGLYLLDFQSNETRIQKRLVIARE